MNNNDREWMKKLDDKLDKHGENLAAINEQNKTLFNDIRAIKIKILGDGKKGICEEIAEHRTYFKILGIAIVTVPPAIIVIAEVIKLIFN